LTTALATMLMGAGRGICVGFEPGNLAVGVFSRFHGHLPKTGGWASLQIAANGDIRWNLGRAS